MDDVFTRYRRLLGDDHLVTLRLANTLAANLRKLGKHEQGR